MHWHCQDQIEASVRPLVDAEHLFFLGRGIDYALACEGSLKLKEISYIHAKPMPQESSNTELSR